MSDRTYDYIIAGGGTAGCLLANRLSKDPDTRVLLVEAGGSSRHLFVEIPLLLPKRSRRSCRIRWLDLLGGLG